MGVQHRLNETHVETEGINTWDWNKFRAFHEVFHNAVSSKLVAVDEELVVTFCH